MAAMVAQARALVSLPDAKAARRMLYANGVESYRDALAFAFAWRDGNEVAWLDRIKLPERWAAPKFPLGGRDVVGDGVRGPAVGELLRAVEAWWVEQDFRPDDAALRSHLQQMIAAVQ
jgi:hypothetical protein